MNGRVGRALAWLTAAVLLVLPLAMDWVDDAAEPEEVYAESDGDESQLNILDVRPDGAPPGGMLVVRFGQPVQAVTLQDAVLRMPDGDLDAVQVREQQAVFQLPADTPRGSIPVQLVVGDQTSEERFIRVASSNVRKTYRNVVGGLGLMLIGLLLLSHGVRHRAGRTLHRRAAGLTSSLLRSLGLGVGVGGLVQTSTFTAGLALPSVERQLVGIGAAAALLLGTQLGAVVVGTVLPLAGGDVAALVIMVGVLFRITASERRTIAAANLVMGLGVLMLGTDMLGTGFAPLAERSDWLVWLSALQPDSLQGVIVLAGIGAAASLLTQGPVPVFVVVVGVAQTTSFLSVEQGLAVLSGTPVGAALSTIVLSSPLRSTARRLGILHLLLAVIGMLVMWVALAFVPALTSGLLGTDPRTVAYAKKILHPNAAAHISVGLLTLQVIGTVAVVPLIPRLARLLQPVRARTAGADRSDDRPPFAAVVAELQESVGAMAGVLRGSAAERAEVQAHVVRARTLLEARLADTDSPDAPALVSSSALLLAVEHLRDIVDRARRRGIALTDGGEAVHLDELHKSVVEGLADIRAVVWGEPGPSLETLRAREIQINATEAAQRESVYETLQGEAKTARHALMLAELASGYEALGNQIYRWAVAFENKENL